MQTLYAIVQLRSIIQLENEGQMGPSHEYQSCFVGAESGQHVNICSFAVRCDQRWPSTQ